MHLKIDVNPYRINDFKGKAKKEHTGAFLYNAINSL